MASEFGVVSLVVALVTFALLFAVVPSLRARGVLDHPGARSSHDGTVVRGGGLACALVLFIAGVVVGTSEAVIVLIAPLLFSIVGFLDDIRSVSAGARLLAQSGLAILAVATVAGLFEGQSALDLLWAPISVLFVVAAVNAFNFMDGINGISALTAIVAGVFYGAVGVDLHNSLLVILGAGVAGSALGFLPWNFPWARVFLGDVGSYLYGSALAVMALIAWAVSGSVVTAVAPLLIYFVDTARTLVVRWSRKERLLTPHRSHIYQLLSDRVGQPPVAGFVAGLSAINGVAAFIWVESAPVAAVAVLGATSLGYFSISFLATDRPRVRP